MVEFVQMKGTLKHASSDPSFSSSANKIHLESGDLEDLIAKFKRTGSTEIRDAAPLLAQPPSLGCISEANAGGPYEDTAIDSEHRRRRNVRIERNSAYVASRRPFRTRCALKTKKLITRYIYFFIGCSFGVIYILGMVVDKFVSLILNVSKNRSVDDEYGEDDDDDISEI